ncbi:hypothetical protein FACS189485_02010 [Spirochaetia bacterium]|nr:hypothetical protein FACS189485_02010 [Spirochaetia bacterium]
MNTAETVVYTFPSKIIERQRWINHLTRYHGSLLAWYIGPETGRLFGVYEGKNFSVWFAAFRLEGDKIFFDDKAWFKDEVEFYKSLGAARVSGVTRLMGKFVGIYKNDPAKPEGRIVYFHRPGVAELREFSCEELLCNHSAFLCGGVSVNKNGLYMAIVFYDERGDRTVLAHKIFTGAVNIPHGGAWEALYQWAIETNMEFQAQDGTKLQVQYSIIAGDTVDVSAETINSFVSRFPAQFVARGVVWRELADDLIQRPGYIDISGADFRGKIPDLKRAAGITASMIDETALIAALAALQYCIVHNKALRDAMKKEQEQNKRPERFLSTRPPHVLIARPGDPAPVGAPDWRDRLQRPGLILLSYARCYDYENESWRSTPHINKYWLAYWVKAAGDKLYFLESNNIYSEDDVDTAAPEGFSGRNYKDGGACSWGRVP